MAPKLRPRAEAAGLPMLPPPQVGGTVPQLPEALSPLAAFATDGILHAVDAQEAECSFCSEHTGETSTIALETLGNGGMDVERSTALVKKHVDSDEHRIAVIAAHSGGPEVQAELCPVEINGQPMLLDHHAIQTTTVFGPGTLLFDDTLGAIIGPDACGATPVNPHHRYTVVRFAVKDAEEPPSWCTDARGRIHSDETIAARQSYFAVSGRRASKARVPRVALDAVLRRMTDNVVVQSREDAVVVQMAPNQTATAVVSANVGMQAELDSRNAIAALLN